MQSKGEEESHEWIDIFKGSISLVDINIKEKKFKTLEYKEPFPEVLLNGSYNTCDLFDYAEKKLNLKVIELKKEYPDYDYYAHYASSRLPFKEVDEEGALSIIIYLKKRIDHEKGAR